MMDYMLPKRVMSWHEAWEMYFEKNAMALFNDLERYGIRKPKYYEVATKEKDRLSHEAWSASLVERRLGQTGMRILTRLMGLVLCAIAVQFIIDGIKLSGL